MCAEAMEGATHWLAPYGSLGLLSYRIQGLQPGDGTSHSGLDPPHQSLTKKTPFRLAAARSSGSVFSVETPFSLVAPACVKLT